MRRIDHVPLTWLEKEVAKGPVDHHADDDGGATGAGDGDDGAALQVSAAVDEDGGGDEPDEDEQEDKALKGMKAVRPLNVMLDTEMKAEDISNKEAVAEQMRDFGRMEDWDAADTKGDGTGGALGMAGLSSGLNPDISTRALDANVLLPLIAGGLIKVKSD